MIHDFAVGHCNCTEGASDGLYIVEPVLEQSETGVAKMKQRLIVDDDDNNNDNNEAKGVSEEEEESFLTKSRR